MITSFLDNVQCVIEKLTQVQTFDTFKPYLNFFRHPHQSHCYSGLPAPTPKNVCKSIFFTGSVNIYARSFFEK